MRESGFINDAQTTRFYSIQNGSAVLAPDADLSDRLGGGAVLATARDLAHFLIATADPRFLSDTSRSIMFTPQKMADGKATNTGIGWRSAVDAEGRMFIHHGGQSMGGRAFVLLYPQERVGVAFVSNAGGAPFDEKDAVAIASGFLPAH